jgi:hypothetical protein
MNDGARRYLRQLGTLVGGQTNGGVLGYLRVGEQVGLTTDETLAAVRDLAAGWYVAYGVRSEAIWLTDTGALWYRRDAAPALVVAHGCGKGGSGTEAQRP